ncbi:putative ATPase [Elusimicrobium posterum]|uniref:AAA family ATPase n=1 Tax=Elusimicrobium posterum TaxID=3116653 RepID=UPI003C714AD2
MSNNEQLKIIALHIHETSKGYLNSKKNIKDNTTFCFLKGYKLPDFYKQGDSQDVDPLSEHFFQLPSKNAKDSGVSINLSAIVGGNGSGKSAIIDMMLRLINNFAYYCLGDKLKDTPNELAVAGSEIHAELFFSIGTTTYRIVQNGLHPDIKEYKQIRLYVKEVGKEEIDEKLTPKTYEHILEKLFYTILLNYSIYAFNVKEYERRSVTSKHWLDGIFHKNDAYQTPLVLNPWRDDGNIDINKENKLAKDRLISLFICKDEQKNNIFNKINNKNLVKSLYITLPVEINFEEKENLLLISPYPLTPAGKYFAEKIHRKWDKDDSAHYQDCFLKNRTDIIKIWEKLYSLSPILDKENDREYQLAIEYLAYKTLSIAWRYKDVFSLDKEFLDDLFFKSVSLKTLETKLISLIKSDDSHITLKIRQALAFLKMRHYSANREKFMSLEDFSKNINKDENKKIMDTYGWGYIDVVPANCFITEIKLVDVNGNQNELYNFSQLSSGERQLTYSISSILYHIRNLNSIKSGGSRIKYNHINVILDEIELYFHPEFQRQFVYLILNSIRLMDFQNIKSINIIMATHSPFILSDIPMANVLFLKNGSPAEEITETFGANIHSLYRNSFFIKGMPIGEFAKRKIENLFTEAENPQGSMSNEALLKEIQLVEEPIIRRQLTNIYRNVRLHSCGQEERFASLERGIKRLEEKLND